MPRFDGTGPQGRGAGTGRRMGTCVKGVDTGFVKMREELTEAKARIKELEKKQK
ncbi:MAG: DUF5320 domain-containing protein [Candidatus Peregrinibacteria bacterium]